MGAVTVDSDFAVTIDYSGIVCSAGRLKVPKVAVSYDEEARQFVFTQSVQGRTLTCDPEDVAWVIAYEKVQNESEIYLLKSRREGGEVKADLPEDWDAANCEFYAFARNSKGTKVSRTTYLQLAAV